MEEIKKVYDQLVQKDMGIYMAGCMLSLKNSVSAINIPNLNYGNVTI